MSSEDEEPRIEDGPHYEIASSELAAWLEAQQPPKWWSVGGDPLLTGRMYFPCPAARLAEELRTLDRPLLVQAKPDDTAARGQVIGRERIDEIVERFADLFPSRRGRPLSSRSQDRTLYLRWKQSPHEWRLSEDSETTKEMADEDAVVEGRE